ncbi:MAG TPA: UDP-glucose/GDP-mannose dehydrogenase family protein [Acidimicrobiia bacterium]|nr:UDP-glucose/GDP-mannose dehydrogenase family protein [Acidimicrobiia bacterium]
MSRAVIVGSGVVGTATGMGFQSTGHAVQFVDINQERVDQLRREGFAANTAIDLSGASAFVFLTLPTPNAGNRFELSAFRAGTEAVGAALRGATTFHTVVVRSTVPPGTCEGLVQPILEEVSGRRAGVDFGLASNPEFLRAACAREDFLMPWMTVMGARSRRTIERLLELYQGFGGEVRTFSNPAEAEFVKCAHNLYNATKISFWNEMWRVARHASVDLDGISKTVALSAEGSFNPEYGIQGGNPYGGACLPKDTRGFLGYARELGLEMPLLEGVIEVNEGLAAEVLDAPEPRVSSAGETIDLRDNHAGVQ